MEQGNSGEEKGFSADDIFAHVGIILKHSRLVVLTVCLVLTIGLFYFCYARPVYQAKSHVKCVYIKDPVDKQKYWGERPGISALKTHLPSERIYTLAVRRLGVNMSYNSIRRNLIKKISVGKNKGPEDLDDSVVVLNIYGYDPLVVRRWGEYLVEEYKIDREKRRDAKARVEIQKSVSDRDVAAEEINRLQQEKIELEQRLNYSHLKEEKKYLDNLDRLIVQNETSVNSMERILTELKQDGISLVEKFSILSTFEDPSLKIGQSVPLRIPQVGGPPAPPTPNGPSVVVVKPENVSQDHKEWMKLVDRRDKLKLDRAEKGKVFLDGHPEMKEMKAELDKLQAELEEKYNLAFNTFNLSYFKAISQGGVLRNLKSRHAELESAFGEAERAVVHIDRMIKDFQKRHDKLRDKVDSIRLSHSIDPFAEISYLGLVEESPGSIVPQKGRLLLFCMSGALLLGIGLAYFVEYMDSSVKTPENVETELQIFGLGLVPELPGNLSENSELLHKEMPLFKESYRVIRTNLILRRDEMSRSQVIIISSSMPQEGKSLNSLELAKSFSELGERTLLIDADLRRGKQTRKVVGKKVPGLADFLAGPAQIEPINFEENLDFLPSGHYSTNAIENLGGKDFSALMVGLRMQYSRIIVDGPPLLGLPDVFMMKDSLDGLVLIISAGHTVFTQVRLAVDQIQKSRIPILGFILNRVNFRTGGKYYRYYYRNYEYYQQGGGDSGGIVPLSS